MLMYSLFECFLKYGHLEILFNVLMQNEIDVD